MQVSVSALRLRYVKSLARRLNPKMKMTTPIPPSNTTPDSVETPRGTLELFDGVTAEVTVVLLP